MVTNYINKDEFQQKIRAMRVKLHMENNKTFIIDNSIKAVKNEINRALLIKDFKGEEDE